ncbi:unnamed protein product [Trifolium pratense]|uniref:Uncharacterized protein n=1 Tax=Trifolium pratense TaxID=57577 RepID=A0ACB0K4R7_TRIPR|nr:unnamed protein product [Trifolium pratense]
MCENYSAQHRLNSLEAKSIFDFLSFLLLVENPFPPSQVHVPPLLKLAYANLCSQPSIGVVRILRIKGTRRIGRIWVKPKFDLRVFLMSNSCISMTVAVSPVGSTNNFHTSWTIEAAQRCQCEPLISTTLQI